MTRPSRLLAVLAVCQAITLLSGCGYFLPTGESEPEYCYRTFTGEHGTEMWSCDPGAQYPRDTLPDALKPSAPTDCITDSECEGLVPVPFRPEVSLSDPR